MVIDVDGTLLNETSEITQHTRSAILKAQQMGLQVVLSSGRPSGGILPLARELELNNYKGFVIAYNGAQIIDMTDQSFLFDKHIDHALIPYLNKKAKKNGFSIFTYSDDVILTDSAFDVYIQHEADLNNMPICRDSGCFPFRRLFFGSSPGDGGQRERIGFVDADAGNGT